MANVSSSNGLEKYPKLRFPGFAEPWKQYKIGELLDIKHGRDYKDQPSEKQIYPVMGTGGVITYIDSYLCDWNCVCIGRKGTINKPIYMDSPFWSVDTLFYTKPKENSNAKFLYYVFETINWLNYNEASGVPSLSSSTIMNIEKYIPSVIEQQNIVLLLSTLDNRIEKQGHLIASLKKYKRGAIRQLLNPNSCTIQNAAWTTEKIGDIGTFIKGAPLSKADISDDGTPFILYGELYTTYNEVVKNVVRKTAATVSEQYYSHVGDVVIPTSGETPEEISTASCIMVPDVILAGDLNIFRGTKVDGRIMSYLLNHVVNNKIARVAQGKSVVHVQASEIANIKICYPDANTQKQLIALFDLFDRQIYHSEAMLKNMKILKAGLLQNMFV